MLNSDSDEYLFAICEVENFRQDSTTRLRHYFDFIRDNHDSISGDVAEFGVFRGNTLIATALLLRELGSDKKIIGFDSFTGFPDLHNNDQLDSFDDADIFDDSIRSKHFEYVDILKKIRKTTVNGESASTSGNFSSTSKSLILEKAAFFGLENIILYEGEFSKTFNKIQDQNIELMAANIDCDLYLGYRSSLNFVWPRLSQKGYIHLDEYYSLKFPGAKIAVDEFCVKEDIKVVENKSRLGEFPRYSLRKCNADDH